MIIESWPVYTNTKLGFSISYPLDGKVIKETNDAIYINFPTLQGTNLKKKVITIHFNESGILSSPYNHHAPPFESNNVEILGHRFLRESDSEGGAGLLEEWTSYTTSYGKNVVIVSIVLTTTSYELYFPQLLPRLDLVAEKETLVYALTTFSWKGNHA